MVGTIRSHKQITVFACATLNMNNEQITETPMYHNWELKSALQGTYRSQPNTQTVSVGLIAE